MRLPLLAALLCAAVGASATYTQWSMTTDARDDFRVLRTENGVYFSLELMSAKLTAKEAASLGRALLEAAGQPEKKYCEECGFKAPYHFQPAELCPPGMTYKCGGVCL